MRRATLCTFGILVILILSMSPGSSAGRRRKILMAKKLAALLLLNKKRYIFVAPFPLPVPLPVITKVKHIIHKEKVPVPVPVPHHVTKYVAVPVPVPTKSWPEDSWKVPESVSASEMSYKISEKPHHHPKNLDKIFAESSHSLKYEKPTYSETPIKMSEKPTYLDGGSFKLNGKSYHFEENDKLPERLYSEEPIKFDMKPYSSSSDESYELPKKSQLDGSYKFNENAYSDELLSKLSGDLSELNAGDSSEYLGESSELGESYPMLQEGSLMVKKKK